MILDNDLDQVPENGIFRTQKLFKESSIGIKTAGIQNGVFPSMELSNLLFKLLMDVLSSTDESHWAKSSSMTFQNINASLNYIWMTLKIHAYFMNFSLWEGLG